MNGLFSLYKYYNVVLGGIQKYSFKQKKKEKNKRCQVWSGTYIIPALEGLRQEFKASLVNTGRPCLKKKGQIL
jgi:hypothetical protein